MARIPTDVGKFTMANRLWLAALKIVGVETELLRDKKIPASLKQSVFSNETYTSLKQSIFSNEAYS